MNTNAEQIKDLIEEAEFQLLAHVDICNWVAAIARAIATDPDVIIADEPTGDLDRSSADEILQILDRLNSEMGKTILMVTHDPAAAASARRLLKLDKGTLVSDQTREGA